MPELNAKRREQGTQFNNLNMQTLCKVAFEFIALRLGKQSFKGVAGAAVVTVEKLVLANSMVGLIEFARPDDQLEVGGEPPRLTAFQEMLSSQTTPQSFKKFVYDSVLQWLLYVEHLPKSFSSQASVSSCSQLQVSLVLLLLNSIPDPEQSSSSSETIDCSDTLSIGLDSLLTKVEALDKRVFELSSSGLISPDRALHLQEQCYTIMMLLFKQWITSNLHARLFLREHDGFNFMLERLFSQQSEGTGKTGPAEES